MTEYGLKCLQQAKASALGSYYQEHVGNIIIPDSDFPMLTNNVKHFLKNNPNWVLGYENLNDGGGYWWLNTRDSIDLGV